MVALPCGVIIIELAAVAGLGDKIAYWGRERQGASSVFNGACQLIAVLNGEKGMAL